jgi:hypothetical protein
MEIPKKLPKFSVEDAKIHKNAPLPAPHIARAKRAKKTKQKTWPPFFRRKLRFSEEVLCFYLPCGSL